MIDVKEYTTVYTSYGLQKDECEKAFQKFADVSIAHVATKTKHSVILGTSHASDLQQA